MTNLKDVTVIAVDCVHPGLAIDALMESSRILSFGSKKLLASEQSLRATTLPISHNVQIKHIPHLDSGQAVSRFMLTYLADFVDTPYMLNIQADGYVKNPYAWTDEFLEYDYIGAPWGLHPLHHWPPFPDVTELNRVGNGGFSIRSRAMMSSINRVCRNIQLERFPSEQYHPEDCYICRTMGNDLRFAGYTFAPYNLACKFSCENRLYAGEFGFHGWDTMKLNGWNK